MCNPVVDQVGDEHADRDAQSLVVPLVDPPELVDQAANEMRFARRGEAKRQKEETADNLRQAIELTDQTDEQEELLATLARLIE